MNIRDSANGSRSIMPNTRRKSFYLVLFLLLGMTLGTIALRLMMWDKGKLLPAGHLKDNIAFSLIDLILYQILIICLAALMTSFLPIGFRKGNRYLLNSSPVVFLTIIALFAFVISNVISYFVLEHFPRDVDSIARLFQAKTFASGQLYVEEPSIPEAFHIANVVTEDGKMYSKYAPGSALVYALWKRILGIQWGVNPFLGSAMLVVLYGVFKTWYEERVVRISLILLCLSPFFIFMTASFHSHLPCLFLLSTFLLFLGWGHRHGQWYYFPLSGLCLGLAFIIRPYTALLVGVPFLVAYFLQSRHQRAFNRWLLLGLGFALPLGFLLYYNHALTGHPLRFPFLVADPEEKIGFGHKGHTPLKGLSNTGEMLQLLNLNILGWPCGLLFPVLFIVLARKHRWDIVLLVSILCLIVGYGFYYWIDFSFGPRFYFEMLPFLVLLSVRGMMSFPEGMQRIGLHKISHEQLVGFVHWVVLLSFLFSFIFYIPQLTRMYHEDYNRIIHTKVAAFVKEKEITNALVLIREIPGYNVYASGFLANALDFRGDVVYVRDRGQEQNQAIISAYPDHSVFWFDFDREKREGRLRLLQNRD